MIVAVGVGRLKIGSRVITDGIDYFRTVSPYLISKMVKHNKRDDSVYGRWLVVNDVILLFKKI